MSSRTASLLLVLVLLAASLSAIALIPAPHSSTAHVTSHVAHFIPADDPPMDPTPTPTPDPSRPICQGGVGGTC
jgi:hypothetical protein